MLESASNVGSTQYFEEVEACFGSSSQRLLVLRGTWGGKMGLLRGDDIGIVVGNHNPSPLRSSKIKAVEETREAAKSTRTKIMEKPVLLVIVANGFSVFFVLVRFHSLEISRCGKHVVVLSYRQHGDSKLSTVSLKAAVSQPHPYRRLRKHSMNPFVLVTYLQVPGTLISLQEILCCGA